LINARTDVAAVGAATTIQAIVAVSAEELIVSGSGVQLIVTRPAADQVAAAGIANDIVPSRFWMTSEANAPSMVSSSPLQDTAVVGLSLSIMVSAAVLAVPRIAPTIGLAKDQRMASFPSTAISSMIDTVKV
jgi:hypothetical protein